MFCQTEGRKCVQFILVVCFTMALLLVVYVACSIGEVTIASMDMRKYSLQMKLGNLGATTPYTLDVVKLHQPSNSSSGQTIFRYVKSPTQGYFQPLSQEVVAIAFGFPYGGEQTLALLRPDSWMGTLEYWGDRGLAGEIVDSLLVDSEKIFLKQVEQTNRVFVVQLGSGHFPSGRSIIIMGSDSVQLSPGGPAMILLRSFWSGNAPADRFEVRLGTLSVELSRPQ